jgi:hypothetical protein
MEIAYVTGGCPKLFKTFNDMGVDVDALVCVCQEMLDLQKDLKLEDGDLKDLVYRMKNRYQHINGGQADVKIKCEDASPSRITFQPNGQKDVYYFQRCPNQQDVPYKQATFFCDLCGSGTQIRKKEIKNHVVHVHKVNLVVY